MVKSTVPIICNTWNDSPSTMRSIDYRVDGDWLLRVAVSTALGSGASSLPKGKLHDHKHSDCYDLRSSYKDNLPDSFRSTDGPKVFTERFRDMVMAHELGASEFYESVRHEAHLNKSNRSTPYD